MSFKFFFPGVFPLELSSFHVIDFPPWPRAPTECSRTLTLQCSIPTRVPSPPEDCDSSSRVARKRLTRYRTSCDFFSGSPFLEFSSSHLLPPVSSVLRTEAETFQKYSEQKGVSVVLRADLILPVRWPPIVLAALSPAYWRFSPQSKVTLAFPSTNIISTRAPSFWPRWIISSFLSPLTLVLHSERKSPNRMVQWTLSLSLSCIAPFQFFQSIISSQRPDLYGTVSCKTSPLKKFGIPEEALLELS